MFQFNLRAVRSLIVLAAALVLGVHFLNAAPTQAVTETVSGTLYESDGSTPVAYASISIHDDWWNSYWYGSTDSSGNYNITGVSPGTYTLEVWAGHATETDPVPIEITVTEGGEHIHNLSLLENNVTFTLKDTDDSAVPYASYWVYNNDWTYYRYGSTNMSGEGSFALQENGTYYLEFSVDGMGVSGVSEKQTLTYTGADLALGDITLSAPAAKIKVEYPDGSPGEWVGVDVTDGSYSWENSWYGSTDEDGVALVGALDDGTYTVRVNTPWTEGETSWVSPDPVTITVESGSTDTTYFDDPLVYQTPTKTISGTVKFADGTPVTNASYSGWQMNGGNNYFWGTTDSNGAFTVLTGAGTYEVSVWPDYSQGGAYALANSNSQWGYTGAPVRVKFTEASSVEETKTVTFEVQEYDAVIAGTLLDPSGNVMQSGAGGVDVWSENVWNWGNVDSIDGSFSVAVPEGTYHVKFWGGSQTYGSPNTQTVTVSSGETYSMGQVRMVEKDATITGRISDTSGNGLANQYVNMWSASGRYDDWGWAETDENGDYTMYLIGGREVEVSASPGWSYADDVQYINTTPPQRVRVAASGTETLNWTFYTSDATITGAVKDPDGNVLTDLYGWVDASVSGTDNSGNYWGGLGGLVNAGVYSVDVVSGYTWSINTWLPWGSGYSVTSGATATPESGETVEGADITVAVNDVTVSGNLVDGDGNAITDIGWAEVFANNGLGAYQWARVESDGSYELEIAEGTWMIAYAIPRDADYIAGYTSATEITVESGETVDLDLTLQEADSTINVTVTDPGGDPAENVWIDVDTDLAGKTINAFNPFGFYDRGNFTDENGEISITVPAGDYYITAFVPGSQDSWVAPAAKAVTASSDAAIDVEIQFLTPDVTIIGTMDLSGSGVEGLVSLYSEDGQALDVTTESDGSFEVDVTSGTTWHVISDYEDGDASYSADEVEITPEADSTVDLDISLDTTPESVLPETASQTTAGENALAMSVGEEDDFTLFAGQRQLSSENDVDVSVTITPVTEVPTQAGEQPLGTAMDVDATMASGANAGSAVTDLDGVVTLTFAYNPSDLPDGVEESEISIAYYDEAAGTWKAIDNIVVDEDSNTATGTTGHFTVFSLITPNGSSNNSVNDEPDEDPVGEQPDDGEVPDDQNPAAVDHDIIASPVVNGGAHYRVFNQYSGIVGDFYAYGSELRGEFHAVGADIDGDGTKEIVTTTGPGLGDHVRAFEKDGTFIGSFFALDEGFRGGLNVAAGDMNNDGDDEVIVIPQNGAANLRVYEYDNTADTFSLVDWVEVYDEGFRAGSNLAVGDFDGNDTMDVAVSTADNSGNVQVYKLNSSGALKRLAWFEPYTSDFKGGVKLTTGDTDNDGKHEIITATEEGKSNLRVYSYDSTNKEFDLDAWTFVYDENFKNGMTVSSADMDADGNAEIAVAPKHGGGPNVRILGVTSGELEVTDWVFAYDQSMANGVNVALVDVDDDQQAELVTGPRLGNPNLRVYDLVSSELTLKSWWWAFHHTFDGGTHVQF